MPLQTGDLFAGKYRLISRIGEGGYGHVWRAHQEAMGRDVAIKMLRPEAASLPEEVERFRREVFNASCLQHPNTITLHDYGRAAGDGTLFIVMEYLTGMTLGQWLVHKGSLPHDDAMRILEQILRSMREAHHHGILHRDIKPENVFLCALDDDSFEPLVKVLDFGLSKAISGNRRAVQRTLTKEGKVYGTPHYMSPEQACAMKLSPASDIYALGLLCWEMLTGHSAFTGSTPVDILLKQVNDPTPPLPGSLHGSILDTFIQRATRKAQQDRFASAREALEWLLQAKDEALRAQQPAPYLPETFEPKTTFNVAIQGLNAPEHPLAIPTHVTHAEPWFSHQNLEALAIDEVDLHLSQLPMIGRQRELQDLLKWGQQAMITGGTLSILGEEGVGKTRLIDEWLRHMEMHASVFILNGRHTPQGAPLEGLKQAFLPIVAEDHKPLSTRLDPRHVPEHVKHTMRSLISREKEIASHELQDPALDPFIAQLEHSLYHMAQRRPTILVLEDLQWADPLTRWLTSHWKHSMATRAIPLVLIFSEDRTHGERPDEAASSSHASRFTSIQVRRQLDGDALSYAYELTLDPLSRDALHELMTDLLPFEQDLERRIVDTTRGNVLHLQKIVRHLFANKLIEYDTSSGKWTLIVSTPQQDRVALLPPDLEQALLTRITTQLENHRLSAILRETLLRALLLGDRFETRLLKELLRVEQRQDLTAYLDETIEFFTLTHILVSCVVDARPGFEFGYDMLREELFTTLSEGKQEETRALHRLVAETLHEYYARRGKELLVDRHAHIISKHWEEAGQLDQALSWLMRAAKYAESQQDFHGALEHLGSIHARLDAEHIDPDGELLLEVRLAQGRMFRFLGEFHEAEQILKAAVQEARDVGDLVGEAFTNEALASLMVLMTCYETARATYVEVKQLYQQFGEHRGQLRCDLGLAEIARFAGDYPRAQKIFGEVLEQSITELGDHQLEARALFGQGQCAYAEGALRDATDLYRRARKLAETQNDILLCSEADIELALLAISTRHIEHALSTIQLAMELKRQIGDTLGRAHAHLVLGMCYRRTHRLEEAEQHARRAQNINQRLHHDYGKAKSLLLQSEIALMRGELEQAFELAAQSHKLHEEIHDTHGLVLVELQLGRCHIEVDSLDGARKTLEQTERHIASHHLELYRPHLLDLLGMVHLKDGAYTRAIELLEQAVSLAASRANVEIAATASAHLTFAHLILGETEKAAQYARLTMTRAEYVGQTSPMLLAMTLGVLIARIQRDQDTLSGLIRRLKVLRENAYEHELNLPNKLVALARHIREFQPAQSAFVALLAIVETLRDLDATPQADELARRIMGKKP